jgi:hypothetical protein
MTPEHLVNSAKLYDYYVNGFKDSNSTHTARVHLSNITSNSSSESTPAIYSAPSLMDFLNTENVNPHDSAALEEVWFNNPDPYDLAETERIDPDLQETVIRSSTRFDIANYVKLNDTKLKSLITKVDTEGPGALAVETVSIQAKPVGKPGEWSVASFLEPL